MRGAYVIFEFWNKHKNTVSANCQRERQFVMLVLVSLQLEAVRLSWLQSPGGSPRQSDGPAHLCLHWRLPFEGGWGLALSEETAFKWAQGQSAHVSVDSCSDSPIDGVFKSACRMTVMWRGGAGIKKKGKRSDWSDACLWGRMLMPVCQPSVTFLTVQGSALNTHMRTTVDANGGLVECSWL